MITEKELMPKEQVVMLISNDFIEGFLTMFERLFDNNEDTFTAEEMNQYIIAAMYFKRKFKRANIVDAVKVRMNALPY